MTDDLPLTDDADPTTTARRFRIVLNQADGVVGHGVVFPPPTCTVYVVFEDGEETRYDSLQDVLDTFGQRVEWVDAAPDGA